MARTAMMMNQSCVSKREVAEGFIGISRDKDARRPGSEMRKASDS